MMQNYLNLLINYVTSLKKLCFSVLDGLPASTTRNLIVFFLIRITFYLFEDTHFG